LEDIMLGQIDIWEKERDDAFTPSDSEPEPAPEPEPVEEQPEQPKEEK
jgi:hypothetical protein